MLNNQIKQNIYFSFAILAIFVFGIITIPKEVNADIPGRASSYYDNITGYGYGNNPNYYYPNQTYIPQSTYVNPASAPTVYSSTTNPNARGTTTSSNKVAKTTKALPSKESNIEDAKNLAANALFGSDGFLPSGLFQWMLFAILVLLTIIFVRKLYSGDKHYYATPMKHD